MPPRRPKVPKPGDSGKATAVPAAVKSPVPGDQAPAPKAPAVKTPAAKTPGKKPGKTPDKTAPGKTTITRGVAANAGAVYHSAHRYN